MLLSKALLNANVFQRAFYPLKQLFTCKQNSSCPFGAVTYFLHPDLCLHRPDGHTVKEAAHTDSAKLWPQPSASFLPLSNLQTPLPLPLQQHRRDELGSPQAQLTVLWKHIHEVGKLLLAIKRATPPVQAAPF